MKPAPKAKVGEPVGPRKDRRPCERCSTGPMESDGVGLLAWCVCGFTVYSLQTGSSHSNGNDSNPCRKGCAPEKAAHPSGSYAPHGKTETQACAHPWFKASGYCGEGCGVHRVDLTPKAEASPVPLLVAASTLDPSARCGRLGCGHKLRLHDEGGCSLAECSCHEAAPPAPSTGCAEEGCACAEVVSVDLGELPASVVQLHATLTAATTGSRLTGQRWQAQADLGMGLTGRGFGSTRDAALFAALRMAVASWDAKRKAVRS